MRASNLEPNKRTVKQRIFNTFSGNMGDIISRWWWGGDPDERNEISGMSLRDIYHVQRSWTPIYANASGNGFLIFTRLFAADPETQRLFKDIATASEAEMAANVNFRAHIINIMAALNTSIQNLNKPEIVIVWMRKLGDAHERHHVKKKHFWVLKDVLVNILQNDLKLSDNILESWGRYVTFILEHILPRISS